MMDSVGDAIEEALGELSRVDTAASVWLPNRSANFIYYKVHVPEGVELDARLCYCYWLVTKYPMEPMHLRALQGCQILAKHKASACLISHVARL